MCYYQLSVVRFPVWVVLFALLLVAGCRRISPLNDLPEGFRPGTRSLLDAHNCYPHNGLFPDRIERALNTRLPLAIEQDLCWEPDPATGEFRSIVSHGRPFKGNEPTLEEHFFRRIEPFMTDALEKNDRASWPVLVLNLEFKNGAEEHVRFVWNLLKSREPWLTTAPKTSDSSPPQPLRPGPMLVLLGGGGAQDKVFHDEIETGGAILGFAAAKTNGPDTRGMSPPDRWKADAEFPPEKIVTQPADNYRRWWNYSWYAVEPGGALRGGDWTEAESARLRAMTEHAHRLGYWIRFYTVNGHAMKDGQAWSPDYNTGSLERAQIRWRAEVEAGVDFIASDMYEEAAATINP